jgi:hypothetical protein
VSSGEGSSGLHVQQGNEIGLKNRRIFAALSIKSKIKHAYQNHKITLNKKRKVT